MEHDRIYGDDTDTYGSMIDLKYLQYRRGMSVNITGHEYCIYTMSDITGMCVDGGRLVMHFFLRRNNKGGFSPYVNENDESWMNLRKNRDFPVYRMCNPPSLDTSADGSCVNLSLP